MSEREGLIFPVRIISHSRKATSTAERHGWLAGARYTNIRDVRKCTRIGLIDIDWRRYDYEWHLSVVKDVRPLFTVARDLNSESELKETIKQAKELAKYAEFVIIVPKVKGVVKRVKRMVGEKFIMGYSVPTIYGGTSLPLEQFSGKPVHLLGGRPDVQRKLGEIVDVVSVDGNRLTLDAKYGDFFDGEKFRPHPTGGMEICIEDSIKQINLLWKEYEPLVNGSLKRRIGKWMTRNKKTG